jgi:hypothetical protein
MSAGAAAVAAGGAAGAGGTAGAGGFAATGGAGGRAEPPSRRELLAVAGMAAAAGGMALLISAAALDLIPHVTDAVSYLFQGRILAAGRLYEPPPAVPALFVHENILLSPTRWCSIYPPGWPLLLAAGWLAHAPWLVCPLLLALAVAGTWLAGRRLYDPATGLVAAGALAASPFALLMAADAMAHVPALCACVWCLAVIGGCGGSTGSSGSTERGERGPRWRLVAAGLLAGLAFLIRPLTAAALLAPAFLWCAARMARQRRGAAAIGWMALGAAPALAALLLYNTAVFGGPLVSGYALYEPARFAHGGTATLAPVGTALLHDLPWYLGSLNGSLWGLPWGDLALFAPLLLARPRRAADAVLAACAAALVVAHSFYYYGDVVYSGPRLAFEALGPLALLAARSLLTLRGLAAAGIERIAALSAAARRAATLAATGAGLCLLLYFPLGRRLPAQVVAHSQWYLAVSGAPLAAAARAGVGSSALVFVAGTPWCYSSFFLANAQPPAAGGRVFVRDLPPLRAAALRAYPRAEIWVATVAVVIPDPRDNPGIARPTRLSWQRLR